MTACTRSPRSCHSLIRCCKPDLQRGDLVIITEKLLHEPDGHKRVFDIKVLLDREKSGGEDHLLPETLVKARTRVGGT